LKEFLSRATKSNQGVAAILRRRKHGVMAAAQPSLGAAQVCRRERGAVGADQDRKRMPAQGHFQRALHAPAEIAPAL
jgi:hypothetical protein